MPHRGAPAAQARDSGSMCRWYCSNLPNGTSTQPSTTGAAQNREATGYFLTRADRDDVASSRSRRPAIDTTPGGSAKWSKNQSFRPQGAYMRHSPPLAGPGLPDWEAVDAAISDGAEASFEFLERLVASPSTVGRELPAQRIVAAELARLGFEVSELSIPPETAEQPSAGVAQADYAGRPDVLG